MKLKGICFVAILFSLLTVSSCIEEPEQPEQLTPEEIRDQNEEDIQLFVEQNDLDAQSTASGLVLCN